MRTIRIFIVMSSLGGMFFSTGCAARQCSPAQVVEDSHILFNPHWTTTPVVAGAEREQWPVITAHDGDESQTRFRETVIDRLGHSFRGRDYYFRRVDSTRIRESRP